MWAIITTLSNRIYLNMVAMAKHKTSDRLPPSQPLSQTCSVPWRGNFPRVIGRPLPIPNPPTRSPTLRSTNSELFYSAYFEDQFFLERLTDGTQSSVDGVEAVAI